MQDRIAEALQRSGRAPDDVSLIAVTKYASRAEVEEVLRLGVVHIAENRVQAAREKLADLPLPCTRHLIGTLQRNKVGKALEIFDLIHSVDRIALVEELSRRAREGTCNILLQVNVSGEATKHGVAPQDLRELAEAASLAGNLYVRGLMTMAPYSKDPEAARPHFARLRELSEELRSYALPRVDADILSMGMSNDFEIAIEEGATHVRIGSAIFGE